MSSLKLAMFLLLRFSWGQGLEQAVCQPCDCCKGSTCPSSSTHICYEGCLDGYRGDMCLIRCPDSCAACFQDELICDRCKDGFYNSHDLRNCSLKCLDQCRSCSSKNNSCDSCWDGYYIGLNFTENQRYSDCRLKCPENCRTCKSYTECTKCKDEFYIGYNSEHVFYEDCRLECSENCKTCTSFDDCVECQDGYYIRDHICNETCPENCLDDRCNIDGNCFSCKPGFYGTYCYSTCLSKCTACVSDTNCTECPTEYYGDTCQYQCSNCQDGKCKISDGTCLYACKDGWFGTTCQSLCSDRCKSCARYSADNCTACKDGYYDISNTCTSECPSTCINNTCDGNSGQCTNGCENGYWGDMCNRTCPINCQNEKCFQNNGSCFVGCKDGFYRELCNCPINCFCNSSEQCTSCKNKKHGEQCQDDCPENCRKCNRNTGICDVCEAGKYTTTCSKSCSTQCSTTNGTLLCEIKTGACLNGCSASNIYGTHCDKNCGLTCKNHVCDWQTGECFRGCNVNHWGKHCEHVCGENCADIEGKTRCNEFKGQCLAGCTKGFHSEYCDKTCSAFCVNSSCDITGKCLYGCSGEFIDDQCLKGKLESVQGSGGAAVSIGASVGGIVALVVIIFVALVIMKRRQNTKRQIEEKNVISKTVTFRDLDKDNDTKVDPKDGGSHYINASYISRAEKMNPAQTVNKHSGTKKPIAIKPSVTEMVSNVYEILGGRSDSMEYSTLSCDTRQLPEFNNAGSLETNTNYCNRAIYEKPMVRDDVREYSILEFDTHKISGGISLDLDNKYQALVVDSGSQVTEYIEHDVNNTDQESSKRNKLSTCLVDGRRQIGLRF